MSIRGKILINTYYLSLFSISVVKYPDKRQVQGKAFVHLIVPAYSQTWQGSHSRGNSKELVTLHLQSI